MKSRGQATLWNSGVNESKSLQIKDFESGQFASAGDQDYRDMTLDRVSDEFPKKRPRSGPNRLMV
jgi:hypothetical protein